ncbi:MAG: T9SS type A sorting domain-containing protein [Bacteroidales bacterium]
MKNTIRISLMVIFGMLNFATMAQDWQLIDSGRVYNYSNDVDISLTHQIWVDSTEVSGDGNMLYFNRIAGICDTCGNLVENYEGDYYTNNHPQFLMKKATQTDAFLWMKDSSSMVIYPGAEVGDSWVFDSTHNLTAQVYSKEASDVFGVSDSVKFIDVEGRDVIISKNMGILTFPDYATEDGAYQLTGIESETGGYGYQRPELMDFYELETGHWKEYKYSESWPEHSYWFYDKLIFTGSDLENDTLILHFDREWRECPGDVPCDPGNYAALELSESTLDVKICLSDPHPAVAPLNTLSELPSYNYQTHESSYVGVLGYNAIYSLVTTKNHQQSGIAFGLGTPDNYIPFPDTVKTYWAKAYDSIHNIYYNVQEWEGLYVAAYYMENFGQLSYYENYFENLRALSVYNVMVNIQESEMTSEHVFPNPVSDKLFIEGAIESTHWLIYNAQGQMVKDATYGNSIYTGDLPPGLYVIQNADDKEFVHRFVKR